MNKDYFTQFPLMKSFSRRSKTFKRLQMRYLTFARKLSRFVMNKGRTQTSATIHVSTHREIEITLAVLMVLFDLRSLVHSGDVSSWRDKTADTAVKANTLGMAKSSELVNTRGYYTLRVVT